MGGYPVKFEWEIWIVFHFWKAGMTVRGIARRLYFSDRFLKDHNIILERITPTEIEFIVKDTCRLRIN